MKKSTLRFLSGRVILPTLDYSFIRISLLRAICILWLILGSISTFAQTYPFTNLPDTLKVSYNINTQKTEPFNRSLLGYNVYFDNSAKVNTIKQMEPIGVRFPVGTPGNFYNWETDMFTRYDDTLYNNGVYGNLVDTYIRINHTEGFPALVELNNDRKEENKPVFDVIWTYSVNYDSNDKIVRRLQDSDAKGMDVRDIEIGNEMFWKQQGSTRVSTPEKYYAVAKSLSDTLKLVKPGLQLSIPVSPKTIHASYNTAVTKDSSYFDAITVHKYVGADPDEPGQSNTAYTNILTGRLDLLEGINYARSFAPDKPVWLTEWAVSAGSECQAAAALSMADCYLYFFNNQNVFKRVNWFSVNGTANNFITFVSGRTPKFPLEYTGYAQVYTILRDVFDGSTLYDDSISVEQLTTSKGSIDAVNAKAVIKDGNTTVFAVNLTDKPSVLNLKINGAETERGFKHYVLQFNSLSEDRIIYADSDPLTLIKSGTGEILLPPLSTNKIVFNGDITNDSSYVYFETPADGEKIDVGTNLIVKVKTGNKIRTLDLYINENFVRSISGAPYEWGLDTLIDPLLANLETGNYDLKLIATDDLSKISESMISIEVKDTALQSPYAGVVQIPGKFEAEDYDNGEEGFAYHDSDGNNQGGEYRSDGVDIGVSGTGYVIAYSSNNEWLEYTIDVTEDGEFDIVISYSSARPGGGGKIGASLPDENIVLLESFNLPVTASWGTFEEITIASNVTLTKGKHILRLTVKERGYNLDWIEFKKSIVNSNKDLATPKLNVYPNPNSDGIFNLSKWSKWEVFSIVGQKITSGEGNKIDISKFQKGLYILKTEQSIQKILFQ